jgi:hypothetical protein
MEDTTMLEEAMKTVSLRQIALVTGANYNSLLKASKAPKAGEMYDPDALNYDAIQAVIVRKIGQEEYEKIDWATLEETTGTVAPVNLVEVVGDIVSMRGSTEKYTVVIKTATHIVLMPVDEKNTQPRVMANFTFKHSGGKVCAC